MRIAVAVELDVNDQTIPERVTAAVVADLLRSHPERVVRFEVHPDPDAVFPDPDEEWQRAADVARQEWAEQEERDA